MRKALVLFNDTKVGILEEQSPNSYVFSYDSEYLNDNSKPSISATLPKSKKVFTADQLFPFFVNMLSEGSNKDIQLRALGISENDLFGRLLATSNMDTIGAVSVREIK